MTTFTVNDRTYTHPGVPVVVICIDGSEPDYHREAIKAGRMPWLEKVLSGSGSSWEAHCAMPALTNPNNLSIATGRPPAVHGISGNYIWDSASGDEVLMNDKRFLRAPTIFGAANDVGMDVVIVTAKDKLRRLLGAGVVEAGPRLDGGEGFVEPRRKGICFSAEKADEVTADANGIEDVLKLVRRPLPSVYSADLSVFALAAGVEILKTRPVDLMYLSLTDYIQHKNAPGTPAANDLYAEIDRHAAELEALGAVVVLTADHGMSAKTDAAGVANILFVEDEVRRILGTQEAEPGSDGLRVILPITDPYTVHHGALGSFASVYLPEGTDRDATIAELRRIDGVQEALGREEAAHRFAMPPDRIGDIVVLGKENVAIGRYAAWHDLSGLDAPLRSHGALGELQIPFIINRVLPQPPLLDEPWGKPAYIHNYDAYWAATSYLSDHGRRTV